MSVSPACPIADAHRRLMDCHDHWHRALDDYMEPDAFRLHLNSLIQALRNVTWLLQKQKKHLPGFDDWYPAWQASVTSDPVMAWVVKARNRIVKEADLELHSTARLTVIFDWLIASDKVFTVPPRWTPRDIARDLYQRGVPNFPEGEGSLTIARRWVDRQLPEHELLDACAHALNVLTALLATAHARSGVDGCDLPARSRECVTASLESPLLCVWLQTDTRTENFDLGTFAPYRSRKVVVHADPAASALAVEKYGKFTAHGGVIEMVTQAYEMAAILLKADGFVATAIWLFRGDELVDLQLPIFTDQAGKMLIMRTVANRVAMLNADGLVLLGEVWMAPAPSLEQFNGGHYLPARKHPDRAEGIQAIGITRDGRLRSCSARFVRAPGGIELEEPTARDGSGVPAMFAPILEVWGITGDDLMGAITEMVEENWTDEESPK